MRINANSQEITIVRHLEVAGPGVVSGDDRFAALLLEFYLRYGTLYPNLQHQPLMPLSSRNNGT